MKKIFKTEADKRRSETLKGRVFSKETIEKMKKSATGRRHTLETRRKMSKSRSGERNPAWKGGITPRNESIRHSLELALWRDAVFSRDSWTCQDCGDDKGRNLNAHHIKEFSKYPELRTAIDNGVTLCKRCHARRHPELKCIYIN